MIFSFLRFEQVNCTNNPLRLFESKEHAQHALTRLPSAATPFGMCFSPSIDLVLLNSWTSFDPRLTLSGEKLIIIDRLTYGDSCLTNDRDTVFEMSTRIAKARVEGHVYCVAARSVLSCGPESCCSRAEDVCSSKAFDYRFLSSIARI